GITRGLAPTSPRGRDSRSVWCCSSARTTSLMAPPQRCMRWTMRCEDELLLSPASPRRERRPKAATACPSLLAYPADILYRFCVRFVEWRTVCYLHSTRRHIPCTTASSTP